jgi:hypothetical protein
MVGLTADGVAAAVKPDPIGDYKLFIAFMCGTAAIGHVTAVFFAMIGTAIMRCATLMMGAMLAAAIGGSGCFVMGTMFGAALVCAGIAVLRAMLCADFVFSTWMISAMFCAIMFGNGFIGAMFQAGFAFFAFVFGAMLDTIMRCGIGFVFCAVFRVHGRCCGCRISGGGGFSWCWCHYRGLSSCFDRFCRFAAR